MKKFLISALVLVLIAGGVFLAKYKTRNENPQRTLSFASFEASLHFKMASTGSFMKGTDQGLFIFTELTGNPQISFDKKSKLLKFIWTPAMIFKVNNILKEEFKQEFSSVKNETFYAHFNDQMVMDKIYYSKRENISPPVQELILNFNKMLAHQAAFYFVLSPAGSEITFDSVDVWGETTFQLKNDGSKTIVKTKSIDKKSIQKGEGLFELVRTADGKLTSTGRQNSVMGTGTTEQTIASTVNEYTLSTIVYKEIEEFSIKVDLATLIETPPWMIVDAKGMKEASMKERLRDWDKVKLQKAIFDFKMTEGEGYKDKADIATVISDMLYLDHSLAKSYYEWAKKLGTQHPLFDEFIRSFSVVGCEDCQKYLVQILNDYKEEAATSQKVLVGIGFLENPLETTEEGLKELANDKSFKNHNIADFMVANMASKLEESNPERAQKIDNEFVEKLKQGKMGSEISHALTALGNSGLCTDYKTVADFTNHKDKMVRKDTIMALRFCKNENVGNLYRKLYKNEVELRSAILQASDIRVQEGLAEAAQFEFFKAELEENKGDELQKRQIINLLRTFSNSSEKYKEQFQDIKGDCSKNNICNLF